MQLKAAKKRAGKKNVYNNTYQTYLEIFTVKLLGIELIQVSNCCNLSKFNELSE